MRGSIEAIAGSQQDSMLGGGLAERAGVLSTEQPRECRHASLRRNPSEYVAMLRHKVVEQFEVSGGEFLGFAEDDVAVAYRNFRKNLARNRIGDREVSASVPILLAPLGIVLDHPSGAHTGNRKCFR